MCTRSGKIFNQLPYSCIGNGCEYFGYDEFGLKCSMCHTGGKGMSMTQTLAETNPKFNADLERWVQDRIEEDRVNRDYRMLDLIRWAKQRKCMMVALLLRDQPMISAKEALHLLTLVNRTQDSCVWSSLICPLVVDNWNILGKNGFYGYESCYYCPGMGDISSAPRVIPTHVTRKPCFQSKEYMIHHLLPYLKQ